MQGVQTRPKPGLLLCLDLGVEHVPSLENLLVAESEQRRHVLSEHRASGRGRHGATSAGGRASALRRLD